MAHWYRLEPGLLPRAVVILDASESSRTLWPGPIASILDEIAETFPAGERPYIAFLGGRTLHCFERIHAALSKNQHGIIEKELGRYPVAGPILRDAIDAPTRQLLLVANTPVLDLHDWVPEFASRLQVYRLSGAERIAPAPLREVGPEAALPDVLNQLSDPVSGAKVGGGPSFVVDWTADEAHWVDGVLQCRFGERPELAVAVLPTEIALTATVMRRSGATHEIGLKPYAHVPLMSIQPSQSEEMVLTMWERRTPYFCQYCSRNHDPGQVLCHRCDTQSRLLPCLNLNSQAVAAISLAERNASHWLLHIYPRGILPMADGRAFVNREGNRRVFELLDGMWQPGEYEPDRFVSISSGFFVLMV